MHEVVWSDLNCFIGRSAHIPSLLDDLGSGDEEASSDAYELLAYDLAWNENVFEATPYAIRAIVKRLARHEIAHPQGALALLGIFGNGARASPEKIQWRGQEVDLTTLCQDLVESELDLYVGYLSSDDSRLGALEVISTFRGRVDEAASALHGAAGRANSIEARKEILKAIDDLREWNEPDGGRSDSFSSHHDPAIQARVARKHAIVARIARGEHDRPIRRGLILSIRQRLLRMIRRGWN
ncbi:hypothetical protein ACIBF5_07310 [Micromonospora sp. NPDC050417]|uniref:hypothetical protein n=1 Tax=Micromonospora sp. NPDC050417 TaxID=3364280 RepID=UPI003792DCB2